MGSPTQFVTEDQTTILVEKLNDGRVKLTLTRTDVARPLGTEVFMSEVESDLFIAAMKDARDIAI